MYARRRSYKRGTAPTPREGLRTSAGSLEIGWSVGKVPTPQGSKAPSESRGRSPRSPRSPRLKDRQFPRRNGWLEEGAGLWRGRPRRYPHVRSREMGTRKEGDENGVYVFNAETGKTEFVSLGRVRPRAWGFEWRRRCPSSSEAIWLDLTVQRAISLVMPNQEIMGEMPRGCYAVVKLLPAFAQHETKEGHLKLSLERARVIHRTNTSIWKVGQYEEVLASKIQARFRGYRIRVALAEAESDALEGEHASKIQAVFRGRRVRLAEQAAKRGREKLQERAEARGGKFASVSVVCGPGPIGLTVRPGAIVDGIARGAVVSSLSKEDPSKRRETCGQEWSSQQSMVLASPERPFRLKEPLSGSSESRGRISSFETFQKKMRLRLLWRLWPPTSAELLLLEFRGFGGNTPSRGLIHDWM